MIAAWTILTLAGLWAIYLLITTLRDGKAARRQLKELLRE